MADNESFETERLVLKPTTEEDAELILELLNTPKFLQFIGDRGVRTLQQAEAYIRNKHIAQRERIGYSNYTMIRKSDGAKVGACGLYDREGLDGIDIGFSLLPDYERQGYAYEASGKLRDLAFEKFKITCLGAITAKDNDSSRRLIEKLGLVHIGTVALPGDDTELLHYEMRSTNIR